MDKKTVKTLLSTASDTVEDSAFRKDATEMYRTALQGPTRSQDGHSRPKWILEALITVLSAYLKH